MSRHVRLAVVTLLASSVLAVDTARGSPDSEYSSMQLSPLCASEDKIVFLMSAESSRGTSFTKVFEWLWVTLDLSNGEWTLDPEADLTASKDPEAALSQAVVQTARGEGRRLADVLARARADQCGRLEHGTAADPYGYGAQFRYSTLGSEFLIHFGERQRSVQAIGARPTTLEWSYERSPLLAVSTQAFTYFQSKGNFSEGTPDDLPPARREKYDQSGRNAKVLVKKLT